MKSINLLLLFLLLNLSKSYAQNGCINFSDYENLKTSTERAAWLKKNSTNVCEGKNFLYNEIYSKHEITQSNFYNRMKNSANKTGTIYTWHDIDQMINPYKNDYEKYIAFDTINNSIKLKLIDNFQEKPSCYSIALFRSIYKKNKNKFDNSEYVFEFFIDQSNEIIFNVKQISNEINVSNHNISDIPLSVINDRYSMSIFKSNKKFRIIYPL